MNARVLKLLLAGEYICPVRYRMEFELLGDTAEREEVDAWLLSLGMRLARLGDEGAFFLAHDHIGQKEITRSRTSSSSSVTSTAPLCCCSTSFVRPTPDVCS